MASLSRSVLAILTAVLPLISLFPFISLTLYDPFYMTTKDGHGATLIMACALGVGFAGAMALRGYRRVMWMLFLAACFAAWSQGHLLRKDWGIWTSKGSVMLTAAYAMNTLALLAIPLVVYARRAGVRVEQLVAVGLQSVLLVQVIMIGGPWLIALVGNSSGLYWGIPFRGAALPVIDALGVRDSVPRALGVVASPNEAGAVLLLAWPALLINWSSRAKKSALVMRGIVVLAVMATLLTTFTRGAYIGLLFQIMLLLFVARRRERDSAVGYSAAAVAAMLVLSLVMLGMASEAFRTRWLSLLMPTDASILNRVKVFGSAAMLLLERPFCGWGVGSFNTLYNVFYSIPSVGYSYADAHSGILQGLLNTGIAGWALFIFAVFGMRPWRTLKIVPLWVLVSLIGVLVPMLSDNLLTRRLSMSVPLCLLLGVCCLYASRFETNRRARSRYGYGAAVVLAGLWVGGFGVRPMGPVDRLAVVVKAAAARARADVSLAVRNMSTGESWGQHESRPHASQLATLAVIAKTGQSMPDAPLYISDYRVSPVGPSSLGFSLPAADWLAMALSDPAHRSVDAVLQSLPATSLTETGKELFGQDTTATASLPQPCVTCGMDFGKADAAQVESPLAQRMTTATASGLIDAFAQITETSTEPGQLAAAAMAASPDHVGLTRYLTRGPWLLHCSADTGNTREEVLIVDKGLTNRWGVVMLYSSHLPGRTRVDSVPSRMFGDVGWRLYCYFDVLPPLATPTLPVPHEHSFSKHDGPWFWKHLWTVDEINSGS